MANGWGSAQGRHGSRRRRTVAVLIAAGLLAACTNGTDNAGPTTSGETPTTTNGDGTNVAAATGPQGVLGLRLSAGSAQSPPAPTPVLDGAPLDGAAIAAILGRLPEWTDTGSLATEFNWPAQTLAPPRTGQTVDVAFPPADQPPPPETTASGPLNVVRSQPTGDVAIAPFVSITFDQPMVPIGTIGQLDAADVPASITPDLPGRWQWIGTRTLRFDASSDVVDRLPMATTFHVVVPAGTKSATGGTLAADVAFDFATPPVTVQSFSPEGDSLPLQPVFVAAFDQRIDPAAVLATVALSAGGEPRPVRLATADEVAADRSAAAITAAAPDARWLAFRPVDPLPTDTAITVDIGPGTPSAEGPRTSASASSHTGHTYAPLRVTGASCGMGTECPPGTDLIVEFNNPLDLDRFDPSTITVSPELRGLSISAYGNVIDIAGATAATTRYEITVPAGTTDVFGQALTADAVEHVTTGSARPLLQPFPQMLTTLDPLAAARTLAIRTVNHDHVRVRVFAVEPKDWSSYVDYALNQVQSGAAAPAAPPWKVLSDTKLATTGRADQLSETALDLSSAFSGPHGHLVVLVEPTETYSQDDEFYWSNRPTITWVQSTAIGIDGFSDDRQVLTWATDLATGSPIAGVAVGYVGVEASQMTAADGTATISLPTAGAAALIAAKGDDSALLPAGYYGGTWQAQDIGEQSVWYVVDDRGVYRPGETVSVKGWIRRLTADGDARLRVPPGGASVDYAVHDSQGNEIATGTAALNPLGGFDLRFDVPAGANQGYASVDFTMPSVAGVPAASSSLSFQIEEFRRPEFEVAARTESSGPYISSTPATVAVDATYYAGGPLGAAPVDWQVTTAPATYAPPGWDQFSFGVWTPWWQAAGGGGDTFARGGCCAPGGVLGVGGTTETFTGTTDANGSNYLQIDFEGKDGTLPDLPVTVSAQASVTDVNRQQWSSTTSLLVHPGDDYVGLRSDRTFVKEGDPLAIDAIVTDIDGAAVAGKSITLTANRLESKYVKGEWTEVPTDPQTCTVTSGADPVHCSFTTAKGGTYRISTTVTDDHGGASRTELTRWVSGGDSLPTRNVDQQALTVVPDRESYDVGDTAKILVQSPIAGNGIVTVSHRSLNRSQQFEVADGSAVVEIPIGDADLPNLDLSFEVVGTATRTAGDGTPIPSAPPRPAYATAAITLPVSTATRRLAVTATPKDDTLAPGTSTQLDVTVNGPDGAPVAGADLAVVVADEAVLAVSGYELPDPIDVFYGPLPSYLSTAYGRGSIVLVDPLTFANQSTGGAASATTAAAASDEAYGAAGAAPTASRSADSSLSKSLGAASTSGAIADRTNFDPLAVFQPSVTTDAAGHAVVDVPLPDNLTRYRVMVVAASGDDRFGSAQSNITARLPLMVRPSAPRFANFGDTFQLPVVVQNQTDQAMETDVVLEAANLTVNGPAGKHVTVPANDRVEVRFDVTTDQAGTARFRVAAVSGDAADAATVELPVYTPATAEAFATYGVIDDGAAIQPLLAPEGVIPQFGGLDITTSSTSLQALTDAVLYITKYDYPSSDAFASRIIAISALRKVLDAFDAPGLPSPAALDATVTSDIAGLVAMQNDDGGFPGWERGRTSEPFNSIQAAHALVLAKAAGFSVPQQTLDTTRQFLVDIRQHIPSWYGQAAKDSLTAYALNVRMLAGDRDSNGAAELWNSRGEQLPADAVAWLWPVIDDPTADAAIERFFTNRAVETAGAANFTTDYGDDASVILHSDRRTDGIVLDSLIAKRPQSDLIPKVVNGLLGSRTAGRWDNIQENSFILLALKHYFDTYEDATPDFVARVWLGDRFAGDHTFQGRSTDRVRITIPTADLVATGDTNVVVGKEGSGRLYYRMGLNYAPANLVLDPLDRGFTVQRTYEAIDDPADVTRGADGTWHIKAGARVRVRLTMVAESQRNHAALVDALPAGLEILNPALATTGQLPADPTSTEPTYPLGPDGGSSGPAVDTVVDWYWSPTWFDHQNLRDDRAEAFADLLPAGTYDYSYVARATTPGTFVAPPTRAEEIYAPETFGRSSTDMVVVDG